MSSAMFFSTYDSHPEPEGISFLTCCCLCGGRIKLTYAVLLTAIIYFIISLTELVLGAVVLLQGSMGIGATIVTLSVLRVISIGYWVTIAMTRLGKNQSMTVSNGFFQFFAISAILGIGVCTQFIPPTDVNKSSRNFHPNFTLVLIADILFSVFYGYPIVHLIKSHDYEIDHPAAAINRGLDDWANRPQRRDEY